eukprot:SAG31_NODE_1551_length_7907_cov_29.930072_2_plen_162_part_00
MQTAPSSPCIPANYEHQELNQWYQIRPNSSFWDAKLMVTQHSGAGLDSCGNCGSANGGCGSRAHYNAGTFGCGAGLVAPNLYDVALEGVCLDGSIPGGGDEPGILWMTKAQGIRITDAQQIDALPHISWEKLLCAAVDTRHCPLRDLQLAAPACSHRARGG